MDDKAYQVMFKDDDWCDFTHATTSREARNVFWRQWAGEGEFTDVRATRAHLLDGMPLVGVNIVNAGYDAEWANGRTDTCRCDLCRP